MIHEVKRRVLAAAMMGLLVVTMSVVSTSSAQAYAKTGCRWPTQNVSWSNYTTAEDAVWNSSFAAWSTATDVNFSKIGTNSFSGAIVANATSFGSTGWDGMAPNAFSCLNGYWSSTGQPVQMNTFYTNGYTTLKKRSVATHEIGHALGLAHVGSSSTACASVAVMNPGTQRRYVDCGIYTPRTDDINGINALY